MTTAPVFLVDEVPPPGTQTILDGPEGRHAAAARRLGPGAELVLTDGTGTAVLCTVVEAGRDSLRLLVGARRHDPGPALLVTVVQALVKGDRGELAVELATEAGADRIVPWRAARCVARWDDGPRGAKAHARWREAVRQAAKQARRTRVPEVAAAVSTEELARLCAAATVAVVLHESASVRLPRLDLPASGELLVVVGPEGGVSSDELDMLGAAGAVAARLGPEVLRASTAATVALSSVGALTSRWSDT